MLEAIFHPFPSPHVLLHSAPIPTPPSSYLLIRVHAASSNPKDYSHPRSLSLSLNSGDDLSGTIAALGPSCPPSFHLGDRVTALHPMLSPGGAYADYALAPTATSCHIPESMSFEEAATIPLVSATAALTLFRRQGMPAPWMGKVAQPTPLIIYGASSSLGTFAVKLARLAGIHPIVAIAGANARYVEKFLDGEKGDVLLDYRVGGEELIAKVASHLGSLGLKAHHAFDCISEKGSWVPVSRMLDPAPGYGVRNILSVVSGAERYDEEEIPKGVEVVYTYVGTVHSGAYLPRMPKQASKGDAEGDTEFGRVFFEWLEGALHRGEFEGHPFEVVPGGLGGVEEGLRRLRMGEAGGKKMVYRIEETERGSVE
jgi:NADPH2:quinone reductase